MIVNKHENSCISITRDSNLPRLRSSSVTVASGIMAARRGIPILSCGRREAVGATAIEMLKPEYEGTFASAFNSLSPFARPTARKSCSFHCEP